MQINDEVKVELMVPIQRIDGFELAQVKKLLPSELGDVHVPIDMNIGVYDALFTDGLSKRIETILSGEILQGVTVSAAGCSSSLRGNKGRIYHGLLNFRLSREQVSEVISCSVIFKPNFSHPHFSSNSIL